MTWVELKAKFREHESTYPTYHLHGFIIFTMDSFDREYLEDSRTYRISSNNKAFLPNANGYSIYANCLDGLDSGVRLDWYMEAEGIKNGWKIETCWVEEPVMSVDEAKQIIERIKEENSTNFFNGILSISETQQMFRNRFNLGESETEAIIAALVQVGAEFTK